MNRARVFVVALGALVALAGVSCGGPRYVYEPATYGRADVAGDRVLDVPLSGARGNVAVAPMGLVAIRPHDAPQRDFVRSLHVRMVVTNRSATTWTLDFRQQLALLPGYGLSRAAYASARGANPPFLEITAGDSGTIDLFFPLPEPLQRVEKTPPFEIVWAVATNEQVTTEGPLPSWAQAIVPRRYDPYGEFADGAYWFNPSYPDVTFREARPLGPEFTRPGVVVDVPAT